MDSRKVSNLVDNLSSIEERFKTASIHLEEIIYGIDGANKIIVEEVSAVLGEIDFNSTRFPLVILGEKALFEVNIILRNIKFSLFCQQEILSLTRLLLNWKL